MGTVLSDPGGPSVIPRVLIKGEAGRGRERSDHRREGGVMLEAKTTVMCFEDAGSGHELRKTGSL